MILCESLKQTSQIYDLMMVAYSVSTQRTHVSRVSLIITEICQQIKIIQLISCTNNICLEYIIDINMIILWGE
jgi:hypothetical protein